MLNNELKKREYKGTVGILCIPFLEFKWKLHLRVFEKSLHQSARPTLHITSSQFEQRSHLPFPHLDLTHSVAKAFFKHA